MVLVNVFRTLFFKSQIMTEIEKLIQGLQQDLNQLKVAVKNVVVQKPKTGRAKRSESNKIKIQSKL